MYTEILQEPFASNPYRLLKLSSRASDMDIRVALQETRIRVRIAGVSSSIEDSLLRAQVELLDPGQRQKHGLAWFYEVPEPLLAERFRPTQEHFERVANFAASGLSESMCDLANWYLTLAIQAEEPALIQKLVAISVAKWIEVDGSASPYDLPEHVFDTLSSSMRRHVDGGSLEKAHAHLQGLKLAGVQGPLLAKMAESAMTRLAQEVRSARARGESMSDPMLAADIVVKAATPLAGMLHELNDEAPRRYKDVIISTCGFVRELAIDLHNRQNLTSKAIELLEATLGLVDDSLANQIDKDLTELRRQERQKFLIEAIEHAVNAAKAKKWDAAFSFLRDAERAASTSDERATIATLRGRIERASEDKPLGRIVGWGVALLFGLAIIVGALNLGDEDGSRRAELEDRISANETRLDQLTSQINSIVNRHAVGNTLPEPQYTQYINLVTQHDALVDQTNRLIEEYNSLR